MHLSLERELPCSTDVAWTLLTDPASMNLWSRARIEPVAPGDGGHFAGVGALRRVHMPRGGTLDEVVVRADAPHRFLYRVLPNGMVREHRGEIAFAPSADGSKARVRWTVDARLGYAIVEPLAKRLLLADLGASIDRLASIAEHASAAPRPPSRDVDAGVDLARLYAAATESLEEQRALADALDATHDEKRWFTRVYEYVTELMIEGARQERFVHPAWVLRLVPAFHAYYVDSLRAWMRSDMARVEPHWASAFRATEAAPRSLGDPERAAGYAVAKGMQAHIEEDLPRALAVTWAKSYRGLCDYVRFRADYLAMGFVFQGAAARLLERIPTSIRTRVTRLVLPEPMLDRLTAERHYDLHRQRRKAFERGERLARMIADVC